MDPYDDHMGVAWGVEDASSRWSSREETISEWQPFAEAALTGRRSFNIMHDDDCISFSRARDESGQLRLVTTVTENPAMRAKIDALSCGDSTYDLFEQIFDGYEIFVPWTSRNRIGSITTPSRSWQAATVDELMATAWGVQADGQRGELGADGPELMKLACDLAAAGRVAKKLKMLITISF